MQNIGGIGGVGLLKIIDMLGDTITDLQRQLAIANGKIQDQQAEIEALKAAPQPDGRATITVKRDGV
jgi:hypothetical protein